MGVYRGLSLPASARFSFLLGIPTIAGAAVVEGRKLVKPLLLGEALPLEMAFPAGSSHPALLCIAGVVVAGIAGYAAIGLLDRFTRKPKLAGFAVYCLGAGAVLLFMGFR
jgi:undecaprenyl-diphosphatase